MPDDIERVGYYVKLTELRVNHVIWFVGKRECKQDERYRYDHRGRDEEKIP